MTKMISNTIAPITTDNAIKRENVLESLPVDPSLLESANIWFDRSWYGLLIFGAATALAAMGTVAFLFIQYWSSGVRERHTEWRTSALELTTAEANSGAAKANVRAAGLEKEAATARLETEKLKSVVAWRTISAGQTDELLKVWSLKPGSVNLFWQDGDPEALFFAIQLSTILQRANWKVSANGMRPNNGILFGLIVPPVGGIDADSLRSGLIATKLPFSAVHPAAMQTFSTMGSMEDIPNAPLLIVGSRKPVVP
jgi:hypothetical protein